MFKIDKLELTLCNDCDHTTNDYDVEDLSFRGFKQCLGKIKLKMCRWMSKVEEMSKSSMCHAVI